MYTYVACHMYGDGERKKERKKETERERERKKIGRMYVEDDARANTVNEQESERENANEKETRGEVIAVRGRECARRDAKCVRSVQEGGRKLEPNVKREHYACIYTTERERKKKKEKEKKRKKE